VVLGRTSSVDVEVEALEVTSAPGVFLPAWYFRPKRGDALKPLLLSLDMGTRNARWREDEPHQRIAAKGWPVCLPDVRGLGDLTPEFGRGAAGYTRSHNEEDDYAWASLMLGRPLLGQRVTDILALARALKAFAPGRRLALAAGGRLTTPAVFAAALDPVIDALYLAGPVPTYREIVANENYTQPFANFLPGILAHTDIPEVLASIAPRKVWREPDMGRLEEALAALAASPGA
jgi:hypothetical protein